MVEANKAVDELIENSVVFSDPALLTAVAIQLHGKCAPEKAFQAVDRLKVERLLKTERVIKGSEEIETVYSTAEMVGLERAMLEFSQLKNPKHVLAEVKVDPKFWARLRDEHKAAVMRAVEDVNMVTVIEDTAGAGKTTAMLAVQQAFKAQGYQVEDPAQSWKAAKNLQIDAELDYGRAITGWVKKVDSGEIALTDKTVLIVDEAGMVGAVQMKQVLERAKEFGCKVILAGDTLQQKTIAAGDPLRHIVGKVDSVRIDTINRQRRESDREAVKNFFRGSEGKPNKDPEMNNYVNFSKLGLEHYNNTGRINFLTKEEDTHIKLVDDWMKSRVETGSLDKGNHLIIAGEKKAVYELNRLAHQARLENGELGDEALTFVAVDSVAIEGKVQMSEFRVGDIILFRRNERKNQQQRQKDAKLSEPIADRPSFDHESEDEEEEALFSNRDMGTIIGIEDGKMRVHVNKSGRKVLIDPNSKQWQNKSGEVLVQHGYAITTYSSQGLSVDYVFVKDSLAMNRTSAGVAMSRHRQDCFLYVDKNAHLEQFLKPKMVEDYISMDEFTDEKCLDYISKNWARQSKKDSTLDFEIWKMPDGVKLDEELQKGIELLKSRAEEAQRKIEALSQKGIPETRFASLKHMTTMPWQKSEKYSIEEPQPLIRNESGQVAPKQNLDLERIQLKDSYRSATNDENMKRFDVKTGHIDIDIYQQDLNEKALQEAAAQDFMRIRPDGSTVFLAKGYDLASEAERAAGIERRLPVHATDMNGEKVTGARELLFGVTFPMKLEGERNSDGRKVTGQVFVVNTPLEALKLRSLQIEGKGHRTDILVVGERCQGLVSERAREILSDHEVTEVDDRHLRNSPNYEMPKAEEEELVKKVAMKQGKNMGKAQQQGQQRANYVDINEMFAERRKAEAEAQEEQRVKELKLEKPKQLGG